MYSRQEASQIRQEFWTVFGQYMSPVEGFDGDRINWLNYRTGEKDIRFRMHAGNKMAAVFISLSHSDEGIRHLYFEQFIQLKRIFHDIVAEEWDWIREDTDENGNPESRIAKTLTGVSLFKREDWPSIIAFLKPRIILLDQFWSTVKLSFEALR